MNAGKAPQDWKPDIAASVKQFNDWYTAFAPDAYNQSRTQAQNQVEQALANTADLLDISPARIRAHPGVIAVLRNCTAPPLARDRLIGLSQTPDSVVDTLETGVLPPRMPAAVLDGHLEKICVVLNALIDRMLFPWLSDARVPAPAERQFVAAIVADRQCLTLADPIIRNAQEQRQLALVGSYLQRKSYRLSPSLGNAPLGAMATGTYALRMGIKSGLKGEINVPIDVVIQPRVLRPNELPILMEAKSAGDFANVNKRRKEESDKLTHLRERYGNDILFVLFLCGYFNTTYLAYEASVGIDWAWEHRITDLDAFGI